MRVPGSALLGRQNTGFYQLMEQLPQVTLSSSSSDDDDDDEDLHLHLYHLVIYFVGAADDWSPLCCHL